MLRSAALHKGSRCAPARKQFSHLASAVLGSLECSALGPPTQVPRGPASRFCYGYATSQPLASDGVAFCFLHL
ncbi:hypothetical protein PF005_g13123 [Phytophthora fragariae]|uniref:Uncharacterized protein n=1 Tax=Phytophthora fragariae TaxID=53985 RepID=A0A6A3EJ36_9STRA|nr:hypothetical protein PF003_g19404 [Phytophthora fragariae]KAE8933635.1 hypothetical protein PF009_g16369 [Phytophthora fragariae]KAE8991131.1 hypothetical protein PF011_g18061 [Phytophthora fragariae]KAE9100842.1 hypothetical protein PF010_g14668 [Phytophthora fragariae]KAE9106576.1 hypothetical protein PF007_g13351 [Phytophthora fragariae]